MINFLKTRRALVFASVFAAATGVSGFASAASLTLQSAIGFPIQHTENSPCIISSNNCPNQPAGFGFNDYQQNLATIDEVSPTYTVGQIVDTIGGTTLGVGIDVSQTNANSPQTLDLFEMYVETFVGSGVFTAVDVYDRLLAGDGVGNVPFQNNNGSGFADWTLLGFTTLFGLNDDIQIYFRAVMSDLNDGPEQIFVFNTEDPPAGVIPLPASIWLLFAGVGGLGLISRRRKPA